MKLNLRKQAVAICKQFNCNRAKTKISIYSYSLTVYNSVCQTPGRGPVPGPGINYTGKREVLLEFVILVF